MNIEKFLRMHELFWLSIFDINKESIPKNDIYRHTFLFNDSLNKESFDS